MSLLPSPLAAALAGTGLACFAIGATRRPDPGLKLTGLAVLAMQVRVKWKLRAAECLVL